MSLVTVSCAVADFVESAWLVAVTWTIAGEGRSLGAVYTPAELIVPLDALPPGAPFTLQFTFVSVVFVTVAVSVCEFPSNTEPLNGATVMVIEEGGGGGEVMVPGPPPQPGSPVAPASTMRNGKSASVLATT
jgi:hypothetical protein